MNNLDSFLPELMFNSGRFGIVSLKGWSHIVSKHHGNIMTLGDMSFGRGLNIVEILTILKSPLAIAEDYKGRSLIAYGLVEDHGKKVLAQLALGTRRFGVKLPPKSDAVLLTAFTRKNPGEHKVVWFSGNRKDFLGILKGVQSWSRWGFYKGQWDTVIRSTGILPIIYHAAYKKDRSLFYARNPLVLLRTINRSYQAVVEPDPVWDDLVLTILEALKRMGFVDHVPKVHPEMAVKKLISDLRRQFEK